MSNSEMVSLNDFLGKVAGSELGKKVAESAKAKRVKYTTIEVETKYYKGKIMQYPVEFLEEFFNRKYVAKQQHGL